jgi:energy-coupling factor transport system permease protein
VSDRHSHPVPALVWLLWALAAAASVQLAPNPLYVALVIAISALVVEGHAAEGPLRGAFPVVLLAGVAFATLRLVLTVATTHGTGEVLFRLPEATLPAILGGFTVGGTVETPVLARAASEGWALVGILAAFGAFNAVVSHYELVVAAPRAFYEVGLSVTVALAFVPSTVAAVGAVREADRARTGGRVVRRGRLLRQIVPILETGMERAVSLSESMDSRGFGHQGATADDAAAGWLSLGALLSLGACFVALVGRATAVAAVLAAVGVAGLLAAVVVSSRASRRVRYRRRRLTPADWALAAAAWLSPVVLALLATAGDDTLVWPSERIALPGLNLLAIAGLAALAVPAIRAGREPS